VAHRPVPQRPATEEESLRHMAVALIVMPSPDANVAIQRPGIRARL
jgi:hypothetical protein